MDHNKHTRVAVLIAMIVILAVFGSFAFSIYSSRTAQVSLPSLQTDASSTPPPTSLVQQVQVTTDTVQAVIATLDRADSYYRQFTSQTFWDGGSSVTSVQTWVDGGYTYSRTTLPSGSIQYSLSDETNLHYWYSSNTSYLTAPRDTLTPDVAQRIPTYEDVLTLPVEQIQSADYRNYENLPCIYVETTVDELGYCERFWISVDTGLLVAAETTQGDQTLLRVDATSPVMIPCPSGTVFALPGESNALHTS